MQKAANLSKAKAHLILIGLRKTAEKGYNIKYTMLKELTKYEIRIS